MAWDELLAVAREARAIAETERRTPPIACPTDGEPLTAGPTGRTVCRFCGWQS